MILRVQVVLLLFLALCWVNECGAQTNLTCIICGKGPLVGKVWVHKRGHICDECYQLETRCSLCGLPVREGFAKTTDGRIICQFDLPNTVLSVEEARRIFNETHSDPGTQWFFNTCINDESFRTTRQDWRSARAYCDGR